MNINSQKYHQNIVHIVYEDSHTKCLKLQLIKIYILSAKQPDHKSWRSDESLLGNRFDYGIWSGRIILGFGDCFLQNLRKKKMMFNDVNWCKKSVAFFANFRTILILKLLSMTLHIFCITLKNSTFFCALGRAKKKVFE